MTIKTIKLNIDGIKNNIYSLRRLQIMLDTDLAVFYKMDAKVLNQAIKGNVERFSPNFMFQLTASEYEFLRSQIVTLNKKTTKTPKHLNILNDIIIYLMISGV